MHNFIYSFFISLVLTGCGSSTSNSLGSETSENSAPEITSNLSIDIQENAEEISHQVTAVDADGDELSFQIIDGPDASRFYINSRTGQLRFGFYLSKSPPNFENPKDSNEDNIYELTIEVSDDKGAVTTEDIKINIIDQSQYVIVIDSPDHNTNYYSNRDIVTVSGHIYDEEDGLQILDGEIEQLTVNQEPVAFTAEDSWTVVIDIAEPRNVITAELLQDGQIVATESITVLNKDPILGGGATFDSLNNRLITAVGDRIQSYDLATQEIKFEMHDEDFSSLEEIFIHDIEYDAENEIFYLADSHYKAVYSLDLKDMSMEEVSGPSKGTPDSKTDFLYPVGIALNSSDRKLYVSDSGDQGSGLERIIEVDIESGERTLIYSRFLGEGPKLNDPRDIVYDNLNHRVLVIDAPPILSYRDSDGLFAINVDSGDSLIIASETVGNIELVLPRSIEVDTVNNVAYFFDLARGKLFQVDLSNDSLSTTSSLQNLGRNEISLNESMAFNPASNQVFIMDYGDEKIVEVDVSTGQAEITYSNLDLQ